MNSGIVRRIDPLGRIVIPKELRRILPIENGDPFEISLSGKRIVLERYSPVPDLKEQSEVFLKVTAKELNMAAAVCSLDTVVFYRGFSLSGNTMLSAKLQELIRKREVYSYHPKAPVPLTTSENITVNTLYPIGSMNNTAGAFALIRIGDRDAAPGQMEAAGLIAKFLTELIRS